MLKERYCKSDSTVNVILLTKFKNIFHVFQQDKTQIKIKSDGYDPQQNKLIKFQQKNVLF